MLVCAFIRYTISLPARMHLTLWPRSTGYGEVAVGLVAGKIRVGGWWLHSEGEDGHSARWFAHSLSREGRDAALTQQPTRSSALKSYLAIHLVQALFASCTLMPRLQRLNIRYYNIVQPEDFDPPCSAMDSNSVLTALTMQLFTAVELTGLKPELTEVADGHGRAAMRLVNGDTKDFEDRLRLPVPRDAAWQAFDYVMRNCECTDGIAPLEAQSQFRTPTRRQDALRTDEEARRRGST